ncbi:TonB-dependent siderophore receptor [Vreelandella alkaliphila]|uniref:TonB-dependent siderophore receptor n=1 Tax=Vreelandella alkaliphila TaxID=272774 RepID=UPI003F953ACA
MPARSKAPHSAFKPSLLATAVALALLPALHAAAQQNSSQAVASQTHAFSIPANPLPQAITDFSSVTGMQVLYTGNQAYEISAPAVQGNLTTIQALDRLLAGSGMTYRFTGARSVTLEQINQTSTTTLEPLLVTGERESAYQSVDGYIARNSATGTKTDAPIVETPQSISVVTADRVEAIGATRLKEALAYTPGVNTSPWGDESQYDWIHIRGFDAYSPGFYKDGLQLRNSGTWAVWQTENFGTERIEVLRGPSSVLYGQNIPGGMINVMSKRPSETPSRSLEMQVGENSRQQVTADFTGPVNDNDDLLYRVVGLAQDAELSTGDLRNDRYYFAPSLTWTPTSDTSVTLMAEYLRMRTGSVWNSYPTKGTLLPNPNGRIPVSTFTGERDFNRYHQDQWMVGYALEHRLNDILSMRQNARYGRFDTDYRTMYEGNFVTVNPDNPEDPTNFRTITRTPFSSDEEAKSLTIDNQVEAGFSRGNWDHTLLFGLDYQRTDFDVLANYGGTVGNLDLYNPIYGSAVSLNPPFQDSESTLEQLGTYAQSQIKFQERWVLTLGGRYDHASVDNLDRLTDESTTQTEHDVSARAGLVYLAANGLAPYISYSESFLPTTTINPDTGKPFSPETGRQYEAGLRYQPAHHDGMYSVAAFDVERQNYVTYDPTWLPEQTGEVQVRGLEAEALFKPTARSNLTVAYTWIPEADVTASENPDQIGKQNNAVAEHQASIWGDYRFLSGWQIGLGARYFGSHEGAQEAAPANIPAYTLLDGMIGYTHGPWGLRMNVHNLTDKTYVSTCNGSGSMCSYGAPRQINATLSYDW